MKTNKIFILLILTLVLSISTAFAGLMPTPVNGKVTLPGYSSLEGLNIEQKNLRTGEVYKIDLGANGDYLFDWSNAPFFLGDKIELTVKVCEDNPACHKIITLYDGVPNEVDFDLPSFYSVTTEQKTIYVCADGTRVEDRNTCEIPETEVTTIKEILTEQGKIKELLKESTVTKFVCSNGSVVNLKEDCPKVPFSLIATAMAIIIAGLTALWNFYKSQGSGLRARYRWIPGMTSILQSKLNLYKQHLASGNKVEAKKLEATLLKYSETITVKYLKDLK